MAKEAWYDSTSTFRFLFSPSASRVSVVGAFNIDVKIEFSHGGGHGRVGAPLPAEQPWSHVDGHMCPVCPLNAARKPHHAVWLLKVEDAGSHQGSKHYLAGPVDEMAAAAVGTLSTKGQTPVDEEKGSDLAMKGPQKERPFVRSFLRSLAI